MLIRVEIGIDAPGIDALLRRSFAGDAEAGRGVQSQAVNKSAERKK